MTVLALPGIAWLVWSDRQRAVTLRNAVWVAGFGLVGAAQYLYLLYMARVGLYVEVPARNLGDLWDLVRGGEFKDEMWGFSLFQWLEVRVPPLGEVVGAEYLLLQATIFATNYDVFDVQVFFLPLLFVLAVFLGLGLEGIITGVVDYRRSSQRGNFEDAQRIERAIDVADRDALFLTDNYAETQYLAYYLVVDRLGEERNLAVVGRVGVSVKEIKRYLHDGSGHVATAAAQVTDVRQPVSSSLTPPSPPSSNAPASRSSSSAPTSGKSATPPTGPPPLVLDLVAEEGQAVSEPGGLDQLQVLLILEEARSLAA